jgi:hypothetical protein
MLRPRTAECIAASLPVGNRTRSSPCLTHIRSRDHPSFGSKPRDFFRASERRRHRSARYRGRSPISVTPNRAANDLAAATRAWKQTLNLSEDLQRRDADLLRAKPGPRDIWVN